MKSKLTRGESLLAHDLGLLDVVKVDDSGLHPVSSLEKRVGGDVTSTTNENLSSLSLGLLDGLLELLDGGSGVERTNESAFGERVSETLGSRLVSLYEGLEEVGRDGFLEEQTTSGGATLSGCAESGENDRAKGERDVGVGENESSVVTSEFEDTLSKTTGNFHSDETSTVLASSEGEEVDALVTDEDGSDVSTTTYEGSESSGKVVSLENLGDDLGGGDGDEHGRLGGLPDGRVTGDGGEGEVPSVDGAREVEGRTVEYKVCVNHLC